MAVGTSASRNSGNITNGLKGISEAVSTRVMTAGNAAGVVSLKLSEMAQNDLYDHPGFRLDRPGGGLFCRQASFTRTWPISPHAQSLSLTRREDSASLALGMPLTTLPRRSRSSSARRSPGVTATLVLCAISYGVWRPASAADLKAKKGDIEIAIHPNLPELYRRKVVRLQRVLDDEATRPQAVEIIRSLIERIEIQPGKERGHCEVIIVGALAQILAFAQQKTTAASTGDSGTFLMVAGACNHRELILPPVPI